MSKHSSDSSGSSFPVMALTGLGILIAVLGFFAAGDMAIVVIGLAAIFGAGIIGVIERLIDEHSAHSRGTRKSTTMNTRLTATVAIALTLVACTGASTSTTEQESPTTSTSPTTTDAPSTSTTVAASLTTVPATTTSPGGGDGAEGSGCTPGPGALPDGEWFGFVVASDAAELEFDLACWFTGDAAVEAAAEDGEESPPPNDYYVRNVNETLRTVSVGADIEVTWYPEVGDPASETTLSYSEWDSQRDQRGLDLGVWLEVDDGAIVEIREQWVP